MRDYVKLVKALRDCSRRNARVCMTCGAKASNLCDGTKAKRMFYAAAAIEELLAAAPKWISVEERLPEKHQIVLFYIPWNKTNMIGWIDEGGDINLEGYGKCYDFSLIKPSHWMSLPEAPKEE